MKKILLTAALLASCGAASAQGYAGALIGLSQARYECAGLPCDKSDMALKLYGGYEVTDGVSVEVGYTNFGAIKLGSTAEVKKSALSVVAAVRYPLREKLTGVGRLGLGYVSATSNVAASTKAFNLYAGLGLEYDLTARMRVVGAVDTADNLDAFLFGAGVQMGF
jgi:OmpA-like transmembrane domain